MEGYEITRKYEMEGCEITWEIVKSRRWINPFVEINNKVYEKMINTSSFRRYISKKILIYVFYVISLLLKSAIRKILRRVNDHS